MNEVPSYLAGPTVPGLPPNDKLKPTRDRTPLDLLGKVYGRLTVVATAPKKVFKGATAVCWHCRCTCGVELDVQQSNLTTGNSTSCGCLRSELASARSVTHGLSPAEKRKRRIQLTCYRHAFDRCYTESCESFPRYGGRKVGPPIKFDPEWLGPDGVRNFLRDVDQFDPPWAPGLTLDRIRNNENYGPTNCRWADRKQQANNTRRNHLLAIKGEIHTLAEWSEISGTSAENIANRINSLGWSPRAAVCTPVASLQEMVGRKFGKLRVISPAPGSPNNRHSYWHVECECGVVKSMNTSSLMSGHSKSCGCGKTKDLLDQQFGRLKVLRRDPGPNLRVHWICRCVCGKETRVSGSNLLNGHTSSCGRHCREHSLTASASGNRA